MRGPVLMCMGSTSWTEQVIKDRECIKLKENVGRGSGETWRGTLGVNTIETHCMHA